MQHIKILKVGDIVKLTQSFLGEKVGTLAVVYEVYYGGVSVITENGEDLGGFDEEEQKDSFEFVSSTNNFHYVWKNAITLHRDFENGVFNSVFKK